MHKKKSMKRIISLVLSMCLIVMSLSGCDIGSKHVEMTYEENTNEDIVGWDSVDEDGINTWDNFEIVSWSDVDEYSDWISSEILFADITDEMPLIDCQVFDYQSNGKYFDGEKVYKLVGDKFDVNSFVAKYAVGTGVIVICVVMTVVTAGLGAPKTVVCFFAGARDASVSMAVKGAAFGAATKGVASAIKSGGDWEETLYGALEGSSDGYMWGAIYGAATGGFNSKYCFTEDTKVSTLNGVKLISDIQVGDVLLSYNEYEKTSEEDVVTQVNIGESYEIVEIRAGKEMIETTPNHLFLTLYGWKSASELVQGDLLVTASSDMIYVDGITVRESQEPIRVISLCTKKNHTFAVGMNSIVVHNRCNPNEKYADTTRKFDDKPELAKKYPDGVYIKPNGYPDFSPYEKVNVKFDMPTPGGVDSGTCLRGDCYYDFKMANKAAGFGDSVNATPKGYTWHHDEDGMTMRLIPTDLHRAIGHDGGEKVIQQLLASFLE